MQPRSAAALVEWAMSPRFRTSFEKEVIFDFLDKTNTGSLSPELGKDLRGPLLNLTDFKQGGDFRAEIDKSVPFLQHHLNPKRHAECAIIVNAIKTPATKRPPFCNYIGVSKLSCFGCASFIKHFNKICRTDWQTSGTHHKIYPWGLLSEGTEPNSVQTEVLKEVHNDFRQILHRRCEDRFGPAAEPPSAISDSSASSGEGKPVGFQEASQTFRDVLIKGLRSEPQ